MTSLEAVAEAMQERSISWVEFDAMLTDTSAALNGIADFFGFQADHAQLRTIAKSPLMQRYSKAVEHEYSPALRNELIAYQLRRRGREIDAALAMLHRNSEKSPLLARALERSRED